MTLNQAAKWLVLIGALNWGLVGIGHFLNVNLNIVNAIFGGVPVLENVVYVLVGGAAVIGLMKNR